MILCKKLHSDAKSEAPCFTKIKHTHNNTLLTCGVKNRLHNT